MAKLAAISLFLFIQLQIFQPSVQEREVLIRDRLVMVLCDQVHSYLETGVFPDPVKKMPEKYRKIQPGVAGSMKGFQVIMPGTGKRKREISHPVLDLMDWTQ